MKRLSRQNIAMCVVALVVAPIVGYGYDLLATGGNLSRGLVTLLRKARAGDILLLDKSLSTTSPDGKSQLVIAPSGKLRWYDLKTGHVTVNGKISTKDYRRADVLWLSNRQVAVFTVIRYPVLVNESILIFDRTRGEVHDEAAFDKAAQLRASARQRNDGA